MRNNLKKILVFLTILLMLVYSFTPYVYAITNDLKEKNFQNEEELTNEVKKSDFSDFQIILSGILNKDIILSDVSKVLDSKPNKNGVWIEPTSRDYILDFINPLVNKIYIIDEDGYLVENKNISKQEIKEEYENNTKKIDKMISENKLIVLEISDTYKNLNKIDNDIIDIRIEEDEYGLLFKDNDEEEINKENIIVLNSKIYSVDNNENNTNYLMTKFLEIYYYNDESLNDKNIENENTNSNNNNTTTIDDTNTYLNDNTTINNDNEVSNETTSQNETEEQITKENIFDDRCSEKDFNLVLAGILSKNVSLENLDELLKNKPSKNGIWVSENSRNNFLNFLNEHTIYTYSCNNDGYLICDNIMKENSNLDILEKSETEFDVEYKEILSEDRMIIIDISNNFLQYDNENNIIQTNLIKDEYKKSYSNNEKRIIILNNLYYSNTGYDLALSDYFIKSLENVQEKVLNGELKLGKQQSQLLRSDTSKTGNMTSVQNVYAGPDASNYFKVGSVSNGEMVYLLGQQAGWYHIQYMVTGTSQQKSGFVPVSTVNNNEFSIHEEQMTGGQKYPQQGLDVQSCDDFNIAIKVGSVFQGEGVTVLYDYGYSDSSKSYNVSYIEFSTSSGTKRGYVYTDQLNSASYPTSVARVTDTNSAYAGPDNSFVKLGGAYRNEFVTILAKNTNNDWVFVEYNTSSGRKRGFMSYSKLHNYNYPGMYNDLATNQGLRQATQALTVYGGPNSNNANIGSVFNQEVVSLFGIENNYAYVEYSTTNGAKRGYVIESALTGANPPTLPNIPNYSNFVSGTYGTSGLGQNLKYYKIGNGANLAFAVFAQHGWEDAWAYDGIELVNIANRVMSNLSSTNINNNWTLYIIPYANPDGITNGYTNNGAGRCTVTTGIDMNRCWPENFRPYYTSRNYTGSSSLGAPEAVALKNFISSNIGSQQKIILDIHGWLNQTYGDSSIAQYFGNQFGFGHSSTYGSGYLETWGKSIGAKSCLVELPMPSSASDIVNRDFSGKLTNSIKNMLNGSGSSEGGTEVYELVKVIVNGSLNMRSGPGTSYSIVSSIAQGTIVTRIRKTVANANGYNWDKIRLDNGMEGYVATNYLEIVDQTIPEEVEAEQKVFSRAINWESIAIQPDAYSGARQGEEEYNSMSLLEHILWDEDLRNYKAIMSIGLLTIKSTYPYAEPGLSYFLSKGEDGKTDYQYSFVQDIYTTDHTRRKIDFNTGIDQNTAMRTKLIGNVDDVIEAAEKFCVNDGTTVTFYNKDEDIGIATMQSSFTDSEADWYLLVNQYRIKIKCTVTRTGNSYTMNMKYGMEDYYDWKVTDQPGYAEMLKDIKGLAIDIASTYLELMHKAGISRNYTNYGESNYTISWTKGQRTANGASYNRN